MVVISETYDDGSDGGVHQNKKPKEEENRNKKLKEKVVVSYSLPIPDEVILRCFLLVRRCHLPSLPLVCSSFRRLMPKLYDDRLRLGYTESVLYAYIRFPPVENPSWYILHRKPYRNLPNTVSLKLCKIDLLPPMPSGSAVVTIGSDIYVIGGCIGGKRTSDLTLIDCKSHKYHSLPRMKVARYRAVAGVIDGKIYVIGGCEVMRSLYFIEVFDVETRLWNQMSRPSVVIPFVDREFVTYEVMGEHIYLQDSHFCYAYEVKERKWCPIVKLKTLWHVSSCVIGDKLFCMNQAWDLYEAPIIVYDLNDDTVRPLKGLQGFPDNIDFQESKMANFGGDLVILGGNQSRFSSKYDGKKEIWCVEISLEEREGGEICGKVDSVAVVFTSEKFPSVELCRTVTV